MPAVALCYPVKSADEAIGFWNMLFNKTPCSESLIFKASNTGMDLFLQKTSKHHLNKPNPTSSLYLESHDLDDIS